MAKANQPNAASLITEVAQEPSLDELGRRARASLAEPEPSDADLHAQIAWFRASRATWGVKSQAEESE